MRRKWIPSMWIWNSPLIQQRKQLLYSILQSWRIEWSHFKCSDEFLLNPMSPFLLQGKTVNTTMNILYISYGLLLILLTCTHDLNKSLILFPGFLFQLEIAFTPSWSPSLSGLTTKQKILFKRQLHGHLFSGLLGDKILSVIHWDVPC